MRISALVALASLGLAACYASHEPGPGVVVETDAGPLEGPCDRVVCAPGQRCELGRCVDIGECGCASDSDCPESEGCLESICMECVCLQRPNPDLCGGAGRCSIGGECVPQGECAIDADCPAPPPSECGVARCDQCRCFIQAAPTCDGACHPGTLSCEGDARTLSVTLRSDFEPGTAAAHVRVLFEDRLLGSATIEGDSPLIDGVPVGTYRLPEGRWVLRIEVLDTDKQLVSSRSVALDLRDTLAITVVVLS